MADETQRHGMTIDEKVAAEDALFRAMSHEGEGKLLYICLAGAILLHVAVFFIQFPEMSKTLKPTQKKRIIVKKYVPPPPKVEKKEIIQKKLTRKVPIPDPTPDEPEPIREPEPEILDDPIPPDVDVLIGVPEPPPPSGPLLAGVGDVSNPILIQESKVTPDYPEIARTARMEGTVIMQAIIFRDGTVGEVEVLRVTQPGVGFEENAINAVRQWRYEPAKQNGKPVEVFFTIKVDFTIH
ncbi:MAG: TonB family protein [Acidobacteriota bacterium]|nr:TonB family protein [Acidobacteriota bacterium]MDH3784554.1 TonB family protein [Acidobacteriota bacterium]